jgi:predicted secreted protein
MNQKIKKVLLMLVTIVLGICLYLYSQFYNYYEQGSKDHFKINVGESFTVKFYENSSAQSCDCWINEGNCLHVKKVDRSYQARMFSGNCKGCGGFVSWTFVGHKKGIDTIKLNYCPPEYWDSTGSIVFSEDHTNQFESFNYQFIVEVAEK